MREPYTETTYYKRLCDLVDDIHKRTSGSVPLNQGFCSVNKTDLYRKCALALIEEKLLSNYGTKDKPSYSWGNTPLTESVYHRVYMRIREINKKYSMNANAKKQKEEPEAKVKWATIPVPTIESFTDQALWDELKKRGYSIMDNGLCKTIYLN